MNMIKVIAVGNRFMRDDGIGIKVTEEISSRFDESEIIVIICETDCQSCFYLLSEDDFVIIIDAVYLGSEPGSVHLISLSDMLSQPSGAVSQHDIGLIELIKIYELKISGFIIGIEADEVEVGNELSCILENKFLQICSQVENTIRNIVSNYISNKQVI